MVKHIIFATAVLAGGAMLAAQTPTTRVGHTPIPGDADFTGTTVQIGPAGVTTGGLEPADIMKPLANEWLTYNGDLSGKRYSALKLVNTSTVKNLSLKWTTAINNGCGANGTPAAAGAAAAGGRGGGAAPSYPVTVGGLGTGADNGCGPRAPGGGMIFDDGIIYAATMFNLFAIDARDGTILWHYYWKTRNGRTGQTRGVSKWRNYVYLTMQDNWAVCLDARTGKEVWRHEIAPLDQQYFSTNVPMVIDNHLIVGTGNDLDSPGFLKSLDPATGAFQWILYSTPQKEGDPGLETWASLDAARHGAGTTWVPGAYDPETRLYMYGTGNPTPAYTAGRGDGDNLFTNSLIAVNVDTGKMAWYFQTSPHDTHDWDSTQTPIIYDGVFNGRQRKMVMTMTRNGYFFVLDRTNGQHLLTARMGLLNNFAMGLDEKGQPKRNPSKDPSFAGSLVNGEVTNYPPPSFSPDTGLFYVHESSSLTISYLMEPDPRGSMGLGGTSGGAGMSLGTSIIAIDYKTGNVKWRKPIDGGSAGLLTTAGGVLFASNGQNVEAWDAATGKALWYTQIGGLGAPAETFMLDGKQHMLFSANGALWLFVLN